jgi:hypothetical protein
MLRLRFLMASAALSVGAIGCAHCDTCDDFPSPCGTPYCGYNTAYAPLPGAAPGPVVDMPAGATSAPPPPVTVPSSGSNPTPPPRPVNSQPVAPTNEPAASPPVPPAENPS